MGVVYAEIELINVLDVDLARRYMIGEEEIRRVRVNMLADSGSPYMAINASIQEQLGLELIERKKFRLAHDEVLECEIVGPVDVRGSPIAGPPAARCCSLAMASRCWAPFHGRDGCADPSPPAGVGRQSQIPGGACVPAISSCLLQWIFLLNKPDFPNFAAPGEVAQLVRASDS